MTFIRYPGLSLANQCGTILLVPGSTEENFADIILYYPYVILLLNVNILMSYYYINFNVN